MSCLPSQNPHGCQVALQPASASKAASQLPQPWGAAPRRALHCRHHFLELPVACLALPPPPPPPSVGVASLIR